MHPTYYLQAANADTLWNTLESIGLAQKCYDPDDPANQRDPDNPDWEPTGAYTWQYVPSAGDGMYDLIGTIYIVTGQDPEGRDIWGPLDDTCYANLRDDLTDDQIAALPTIPAPASPYRIWAGDE